MSDTSPRAEQIEALKEASGILKLLASGETVYSVSRWQEGYAKDAATLDAIAAERRDRPMPNTTPPRAEQIALLQRIVRDSRFDAQANPQAGGWGAINLHDHERATLDAIAKELEKGGPSEPTSNPSMISKSSTQAVPNEGEVQFIAEEMLECITSGRLVSIGAINNTYSVQIHAGSVMRWWERLAALRSTPREADAHG